MTGIDERIGKVEDHMAITDLIANYSHAFDREDRNLLRGIFFDDAVLHLGVTGGPYEGIDAIMATADDLWLHNPVMHHWVTNTVVTLNAHHATAISSMQCVIVHLADGPTECAGQYTDQFQRRNGTWKMTRRDLDLDYLAPLPNWAPTIGAARDKLQARLPLK